MGIDYQLRYFALVILVWQPHDQTSGKFFKFMYVMLDVDGVLNSTAWLGKKPLRALLPPATAREAIAEERLDPDCIARLQALVKRTGAHLVITSTWRKRLTVADFMAVLDHYGFKEAPVIGATPVMNGKRGREVFQWISEHHPGAPYVCLDDDADFDPGQALVQINSDVGLQDPDVERAIETLHGFSR